MHLQTDTDLGKFSMYRVEIDYFPGDNLKLHLSEIPELFWYHKIPSNSQKIVGKLQNIRE